jgi:hypothetical protein
LPQKVIKKFWRSFYDERKEQSAATETAETKPAATAKTAEERPAESAEQPEQSVQINH